MLYSDRRFDISDLILKNISRANNRKKLDSRTEKKEAEKEVLIDDKYINEEDNEEDNVQENINQPKKRLTVKELLEQRKQKNNNKRKVKD